MVISAGQGERWAPTARSDGTVDDLELSEWVGQALRAASMCWSPRPVGVFDSVTCAGVHAVLMERINAVIDAVIAGTAAAAGGQDLAVVESTSPVNERTQMHTVDLEPVPETAG